MTASVFQRKEVNDSYGPVQLGIDQSHNSSPKEWSIDCFYQFSGMYVILVTQTRLTYEKDLDV